MATIASLNISVRAITSDFTKGLNKAEKALLNFAKNAASVAAGQLLANGLQSAASGLSELTKNAFESIDAAAKLSDTLNTDIQQLRGLQYAAALAGASTETVNKSLQKLGQNIGEALGGNVASQQAIEKLGLSIADLAKADSVTQFKQISDAIRKLPTPAQQAEAAVGLFGKSAQELLPILAAGSEEIEASIAEFETLNGSINRIDAAKVEMANDSMSRLKTVISGTAERIAVELSPYIDGAIKSLISMGFNGKNAADYIINGVQWITEAIASLLDYLKLGEAIWHAFSYVINEAVRWAVQAIGNIGVALDLISQNTIGVALGIEEFIGGLVGGLAKSAESEFAKAGQAMVEFENKTNSKAANAYFNDLRKNADAAAKKIAETAQAKAELQRQAELVINKPEETKQDSALKKMQDKAKQIAESLRSPFEKFKDELGELGNLFAEGLLDENLFRQAGEKALAEFDKQTSKSVKRGGEFRSIDSQNISVRGLSRSATKEQTVHDPQLKEANRLLKGILNKDVLAIAG